MLEIEKDLHEKGYEFIAGIDEVGRGPLAGPVCAAAVILPKDLVIDGINDSKKLSEKKREKLYIEIIENAVDYSVEFVSPQVIDDIRIRMATHLAMANAVANLEVIPNFLIVDGNDNIDFDIPSEYIIKGDGKAQAIAAASIIAKVTRDRYMKTMDDEYPEYAFAKNKGYGTKVHMEAIREFGLTDIHRKTFITKKVLGIE